MELVGSTNAIVAALTPLVEVGVIAPRVKVIAGVVVAVATVPETPFAVTTETAVTVPVPVGVKHPTAFPFAPTPVAATPAPQFVGVDASAVAVAALPVVLWFSAGMSAATIERSPTAPVVPLGVARNWFAVSPVVAENVCVPLADMVAGEAVSHDGSAQVMLPMPEPEPLKVYALPT